VLVRLRVELQDIYGIGERMEQRLHRAGIFHRRRAMGSDPVPAAPGVGRHQRLAVSSDAAWR
jgi:nucleotidyltransferase/DNA polymerase involved in DNA repair